MTYPYEFITAGSGPYINDVVGQNVGKHKLVYRSNADTWLLADADALATMPPIGITLAAIPNGNRGLILLSGYVGDPAWTWTTGGSAALIYASQVAGELTQTAPGAPALAHVVAIAWFSNGLFFNAFPPTQGLDLGSAEEWLFRPSNPDTNIGTHAAVRLTDLADVLVRMDFLIPADFDLTTWSVDALVVPGGNGDICWGITTNWGAACTESYVANNDSIAAAETTVVINIIECLDITSGLNTVVARDVVGMEFTRYGSHGNDTVNADCYFLGVLIRRP